jgi:hypothetical protein
MCGGKEEVVAVLYYTKAKEERPLRKQSDIGENYCGKEGKVTGDEIAGYIHLFSYVSLKKVH